MPVKSNNPLVGRIHMRTILLLMMLIPSVGFGQNLNLVCNGEEKWYSIQNGRENKEPKIKTYIFVNGSMNGVRFHWSEAIIFSFSSDSGDKNLNSYEMAWEKQMRRVSIDRVSGRIYDNYLVGSGEGAKGSSLYSVTYEGSCTPGKAKF